MELVDSDKIRGLAVPVWDEYKQLLSQAGSQVNQPIWKWCDHKTNKVDLIMWMFTQSSLELVERFAFYERAKKAFAVVATGSVFPQ